MATVSHLAPENADVWLLAVETSTPRGSVAVFHGEKLVFESSFEAERQHNSRIFDALRGALAAAARLDRIAVGTGPGSYTGVRIGIAAAIGLSLAKGATLFGLESLLAADDEADTYAVAGDARRGLWHFSQVSQRRLAAPPMVGSPEEIAPRLAEKSGPLFTFDSQLNWLGARHIFPSAKKLGQLAQTLPAEEIQHRAAAPLEPTYLAAPYVTTPRG